MLCNPPKNRIASDALRVSWALKYHELVGMPHKADESWPDGVKLPHGSLSCGELYIFSV